MKMVLINGALAFWIMIYTAAGIALAAAGDATAPADEAVALMREIDAMALPEADPTRFADRAYSKEYDEKVEAFHQLQGDRVKALSDRFGADPRVKKFLLDRWLKLARTGEKDVVFGETTRALAGTSDASERIELLYARAEASAWLHDRSKAAEEAVEEFIRAAPQDERGSELLFRLAEWDQDPKRQIEIFRRAASEPYAATTYGRLSRGAIVQAEGIGKPFESSFTDAITGKPVSLLEDYKGKIVVIDFWATSCPACCSAMPENLALYAKYKRRGIEFICVSLDEPESQGASPQ